MNPIKLLISILLVSFIMEGALAFKKPMGEGTVYCGNTCTSGTMVDYRIDPNGAITAPCGLTGGIPNPVYSWNYFSGCPATCSQISTCAHYSATSL